jgi:hypothetical protein
MKISVDSRLYILLKEEEKMNPCQIAFTSFFLWKRKDSMFSFFHTSEEHITRLNLLEGMNISLPPSHRITCLTIMCRLLRLSWRNPRSEKTASRERETQDSGKTTREKESLTLGRVHNSSVSVGWSFETSRFSFLRQQELQSTGN